MPPIRTMAARCRCSHRSSACPPRRSRRRRDSRDSTHRRRSSSATFATRRRGPGRCTCAKSTAISRYRRRRRGRRAHQCGDRERNPPSSRTNICGCTDASRRGRKASRVRTEQCAIACGDRLEREQFHGALALHAPTQPSRAARPTTPRNASTRSSAPRGVSGEVQALPARARCAARARRRTRPERPRASLRAAPCRTLPPAPRRRPSRRTRCVSRGIGHAPGEVNARRDAQSRCRRLQRAAQLAVADEYQMRVVTAVPQTPRAQAAVASSDAGGRPRRRRTTPADIPSRSRATSRGSSARVETRHVGRIRQHQRARRRRTMALHLVDHRLRHARAIDVVRKQTPAPAGGATARTCRTRVQP